MKSNRTKLAIVAVFCLTLGASVVTGLLVGRLSAAKAPVGPSADQSLAEQLGLSDGQREKMRGIWEGVRELSSASLTQAEAARTAQERSIAALIPGDKMDQYNKIRRDYTETCANLQGRRKAAFERAVRQTREILNSDQWARYDAILKARLGKEGMDDHDPAGPTEPSGP